MLQHRVESYVVVALRHSTVRLLRRVGSYCVGCIIFPFAPAGHLLVDCWGIVSGFSSRLWGRPDGAVRSSKAGIGISLLNRRLS